jgi:S-adenosylmethionine-diacylglycerol 3-amino-3-carboxypropyl transferase
VGRAGGRAAYWNLFVPRDRPEALAGRLQPLTARAAELHARDKVFFYGRFVLDAMC